MGVGISEIGLATAQRFLADGWRVALLDQHGVPVARSLVASWAAATWRRAIPVRSRIQASVVSSVASKWLFGTTRAFDDLSLPPSEILAAAWRPSSSDPGPSTCASTRD